MNFLDILSRSMRRRYHSYSYRVARSASPEKLQRSWDTTEERTFSDHVDNIIHHSRANSEVRVYQVLSEDNTLSDEEPGQWRSGEE